MKELVRGEPKHTRVLIESPFSPEPIETHVYNDVTYTRQSLIDFLLGFDFKQRNPGTQVAD